MFPNKCRAMPRLVGSVTSAGIFFDFSVFLTQPSSKQIFSKQQQISTNPNPWLRDWRRPNRNKHPRSGKRIKEINLPKSYINYFVLSVVKFYHCYRC